MRYTNEQTLERYKKFDEVFLNPKTTVVAQRAGINRSALASFLNKRAVLSDNGLEKLNKFLDEKFAIIKEEELKKVKELECV